MPSREIGAADVTHFAGLDKRVEGAQRFFDRREGVKTMHLVEVNVISSETAKAGLAGADEMVAGVAKIVDAGSHGKRGFGRNEEILPATFNRLAQNLFRETF